jgi:hypothetical protein
MPRTLKTLLAIVLVLPTIALAPDGLGASSRSGADGVARPARGALRIDLRAPPTLRQRTAPAAGWQAYHGEPYSPAVGYGWLETLPAHAGADRGLDAPIVLADGTRTSARQLGRPELAHWQGTHRENLPRVFRVDVPDGWYRVACTSVDPGTPLPLVDQRGFKCRAHGTVFAGPEHGRPLVAGGATLVEGTGVVEVTDGHLRIVIGDPAYPGWTWRHPGPWYEGWGEWWGRWGGQRYAEPWLQKLTRRVDPGFHSLRLNSLSVEPVPAPAGPRRIVFRDLFNRDDAADVNRHRPDSHHWVRHDTGAGGAVIDAALFKTSLTLTADAPSSVAFLQRAPSPATGLVRYRTRVSLAGGEGSQSGQGVHEAGLILLAEPAASGDVRATFVGVSVAAGGRGGLTLRVGDRAAGYAADVRVAHPLVPFEVGAGEYELVVEHDVAGRRLTRIAVNGADVTTLVSPEALRQTVDRGLFGIRASMDPGPAAVALRQSYWLYEVECVSPTRGRPSC